MNLVVGFWKISMFDCILLILRVEGNLLGIIVEVYQISLKYFVAIGVIIKPLILVLPRFL